MYLCILHCDDLGCSALQVKCAGNYFRLNGKTSKRGSFQRLCGKNEQLNFLIIIVFKIF